MLTCYGDILRLLIVPLNDIVILYVVVSSYVINLKNQGGNRNIQSLSVFKFAYVHIHYFELYGMFFVLLTYVAFLMLTL